MVNCYVDPPIPMNWNVGGCFDNLPAKTNIESLNTHFFGLEVLLENASFLNSTKLTMEELPNSDYYGVIIWNDFFFFFSSKRRHTRWTGDWSSDVCSSD